MIFLIVYAVITMIAIIPMINTDHPGTKLLGRILIVLFAPILYPIFIGIGFKSSFVISKLNRKEKRKAKETIELH